MFSSILISYTIWHLLCFLTVVHWNNIFMSYPQLHFHLSFFSSFWKLWICINMLFLKIFPRLNWLQQMCWRFYYIILYSFSQVTLNILCKIHAKMTRMHKGTCCMQKMEHQSHGMFVIACHADCLEVETNTKGSVRQKVIWPTKHLFFFFFT